MPNEAPKKSFGTIAILGLIVVVLSSILFLLPTLSNDQSEVYNFSLPLIGAASVHRNQLMFILIAELFFMGGIYLLVKGLRSNQEVDPIKDILKKKDGKKEDEEQKEEPSSLENVLADEKKAEDTRKQEDAANAPLPEKKTEETPDSEPIRTTGPIHLSNGAATPVKEEPAAAPKEAAPAAPK